ncbi:hypothetical protein HYX08_01805 [Candidatus Woesearchaeota archaeon]|nr:hypothetical protein [Candidatus Woesearchaeota archaeon]
MVFKDELYQYDENSIFICFYCEGNVNKYSIFKKNNLEWAKNGVAICGFCNQYIEPFKSISDCINECKKRLKYYAHNVKFNKNKEKMDVVKKIINALQKKQKEIRKSLNQIELSSQTINKIVL